VLIKARLKGHEFDLLTLAELFGEGEPAVATDDEGYYLRFTVPDGLFGDGGGLHDAASKLLRRVNGVARTISSDARPVGLSGRFSDETGRQHQVVLADSAEVRARANPVRVSVRGEQPPAPPAPAPGYVQLAQTHPEKGDPPTRTMTLGEARQLIGALDRRWLDWLREPSTPEALDRP
jgi:hypothetical protein